MRQTHSISVALLGSLFSCAKKQGVNITQVLKNAGVPEDTFLINENHAENEDRLNLENLGPILRALWFEMGDEASGFLKRPLKIGMFSMMCHSIITAGNLRRALLRSSRFLDLLNEDLQIDLEESGDEARLTVNYTNPHQVDSVFFITSIFVIWIRLSCWLINRSILLERIEFTFDEPEYSNEFDLMFPCRHRFSQAKNSVIFNKKILALPIEQDNESLIQFLHNAPESLLTQFRADESTSAQIKRLLSHSNGIEKELDNLSFEDVAQSLNMTTHTIRRRLKEEGNSFQEIKDSIRRDQAFTLLENTSIPLIIISEKLGFSETASFNRAFKKWTGLTPGAYRSTFNSI